MSRFILIGLILLTLVPGSQIVAQDTCQQAITADAQLLAEANANTREEILNIMMTAVEMQQKYRDGRVTACDDEDAAIFVDFLVPYNNLMALRLADFFFPMYSDDLRDLAEVENERIADMAERVADAITD